MPAPLRCVYCDIDGTLVGRGGSLFHDAEGTVTMAGARAVEACLRAGVEIVLVSGRRRVRSRSSCSTASLFASCSKSAVSTAIGCAVTSTSRSR